MRGNEEGLLASRELLKVKGTTKGARGEAASPPPNRESNNKSRRTQDDTMGSEGARQAYKVKRELRSAALAPKPWHMRPHNQRSLQPAERPRAAHLHDALLAQHNLHKLATQ